MEIFASIGLTSGLHPLWSLDRPLVLLLLLLLLQEA
jgi:hypothetical protein